MAIQEKKRRRGYVYVMSNPSMPGIMKIGRTFRDPRTRSAELSAPTGVPTPFKIEATVSTWNCVWLEKLVHLRLARCRVNSNREFFRCTLEEALKATDAASKKMKGNRFRRAAQHPSGILEWTSALAVSVGGWMMLLAFDAQLAVAWIVACGVAMLLGWPRWFCRLLLLPTRLGWFGGVAAVGAAAVMWLGTRKVEYFVWRMIAAVV